MERSDFKVFMEGAVTNISSAFGFVPNKEEVTISYIADIRRLFI